MATRFLEARRRDVANALRALSRSLALVVTVTVTLGLGVGANAAVFTVLDPVFFQLPGGVNDPGAIRRLYALNISKRIPGGRSVTPYLDARDLSDLTNATRGIAQVAADYLDRGQRLSPSKQPVILTFASSGYFSFLGIRPALGRFFTPEENRIGSPIPVAVLSDAFWRTHFATDPNVLGKTVRVDETTYTIVGVAPPSFEGLELEAVDLWVPLPLLGGWDTPPLLHVITRLDPGASEGALHQALNAQYHETHRGDPKVEDSSRIIIAPLLGARGPTLTATRRVGRMSDRYMTLLTRLAGVGLAVLVIASANVASLLLMRALRRRREIAIRVALGASRGRLVWQLMTESVILAVAAGAVALLIAWWTGSLLRTQFSYGLARWTQAVISDRVVAFAGLVAVASGVAAGLAPAWFAFQIDVNSSLKSSSSGTTTRGSRLRVGLLVTQAALCMALLACGGAFLQSLRHAGDFDRGFDAEQSIQVAVPAYYTNSEGAIGEIATRLRSQPGIEAVGRSYVGLGELGLFTKVGPSYSDTIGVGPNGPSLEFVEPDYMRAAGYRVVAGRPLTPDDTHATVAIINEALAKALFPVGKAIGSCVHVREPDSPCREVVGVVRDVRWDVTAPPAYRVYVPFAQAWTTPPRALIPNYLIVRMRSAVSAADVARLRNTIIPILPSPYADLDVDRVSDLLEPQLRPWRVAAALFLLLGVLGLGAAAAGIYGLVAYDVTQRSRELGVRIALGATSASIIQLVVGSGLRVVLIGAAAGTAAAVIAGRVVASLVFATSPYDPVVLLPTALTLTAAAILASLVPAWRAIRVDPVIALSSE